MCDHPAMAHKTLPDLIGSKDACLILDVDRTTLTRWVLEDRIPIVGKLPGKSGALLFDKTAIEKIAAQRTQDQAVS